MSEFRNDQIDITISNSKDTLSGLRHFLTIESPLKMMKNIFFNVKSSFCSWDIYIFVLTFWQCKKNSLIRKLWLISKFKVSQTGQQIITINILPNISRNKDNKANKFCHLIKFRMRNFFFENHTENNTVEHLGWRFFVKIVNG